MSKGLVCLVGAGPGNPRLLTLEALKLLENAEVVVYDNLVTSDILKLAPETAEKIFVGKQPGSHPVPQNEINAILVAKGLQGRKVVRLKGGDPFLFGRGGEEAEELKKHGVKFMVVPGITSALAVPAYAGIPVTHRKYSSSVAIVTGHEDPTKIENKVQWAKLAMAVDTVVVLMGVENLAGIAEELIKGGREPKTEVAIIESGTTRKQRVTKGTLDNIASIAVKHKVNSPAVIVIGDVVGLQNELSWFGG